MMLPLVILAGGWLAQDARTITLDEAVQLALQNHPRIASADLLAKAAQTNVTQVKSAYAPLVSGSITGAGAESHTALAAGALQTSALASRMAAGIGLSQLITDFGRTMKVAESARLSAQAQESLIKARRAETMLQVHQAYYGALGSEAVLQVARATVDARQLTLRQVRALADSNLRSTLDVSFADVAVSEAELALVQAENGQREAHALLSAAIGYSKDEPFALAPVATPPPLEPNSEALVQSALNDRPDLASARLNETAAQRFADAERKLRYPTITGLATIGAIPLRSDPLTSRYLAAGVNVTLPFLNGGLLSARRAEAEYRAQAAGKDAQTLSLQVASAVQVSWLQANTSFRRIAVTERMVGQADLALRLANTRYEAGLGGILEVTQAQLTQTSARIAEASARYEYLIRLANLHFATGNFQ